MQKIYLSTLLDMGDIELQNWLIENMDRYVLVEKSSLPIEHKACHLIHDESICKNCGQ